MPIYTYECDKQHKSSEYKAMDDRNKTPLCFKCGELTQLVISIPKAKPTFGNQGTLWDMRERHRLGKG